MIKCIRFFTFCNLGGINLPTCMINDRIPVEETENSIYTLRHIYIASDEHEKLFFTPHYAGHYVTKKYYAIRQRVCGDTLLLMTLSGRGELLYREKTYLLTAGTVAILDAETPHSYYSLEEGWAFKYIHWGGAMREQYTSHLQKKSGPMMIPTSPTFLNVIEHTDRILAMMEQPQLGVGALLSGEIYAILVALLGDEDCCDTVSELSRQLIGNSITYIKTHYREPLNVDQLAQQCFLSRPYFSKLFRRVTGIAPHEYLLLCRLTHAKQMLTESSLSVTQIGAAVGFPDASSFTRAFERYYGAAPSKYRKNRS